MKIIDITEKYNIYNNGEKDIRVYDGEEPPEGFVKGSFRERVPWNKGLTKDTDDRVKLNSEKMTNTRKNNGTYDTSWNSGLTKDTDERVARSVKASQEAIKTKYGVDNISQYVSKQHKY